MIINSPYVSGSLTVSCNINVCGTINGTANICTSTLFASTRVCSPNLCATTTICGPAFVGGTMSGTTLYGSTAACAPTVFGTTAVCSPTIFASTVACAPTVFGTTAACAPTVFGTTAVCAPTVFGTTAVCSPTVFGTTVVCGGSVCTTGNICAAGSITGSAILSTGRITAQTLVVSTISSSVTFSSGSNIFGNSTANTQTMTGSVNITGSLSVTTSGTSPEFQVAVGGTTIGNALTDVHQVTGSLFTTGSTVCFSPLLRLSIDTSTGSPITAYSSIQPSGFDFNTVCSTGNRAVRIYATNTLAASPNGAAIQFFSSDHSAFCGQFYIDSGANNNAALIFRTAVTSGNITERMRITATGIACFACQTCAPGMDIMPSGIGVSTLGGIMRVVTTGTSTGIAVGQSNSNRYTHFAANDIQVFNDDFFLTTRCAFPLSIGTCYTARLTFAATGVACFSCRVCVPAIIITGCAATTIFEAYNQNTDDGNGLYIKAGGVNTGKYIMALESAAGCSRMIVLANGNVGIGTTTTVNKLDVRVSDCTAYSGTCTGNVLTIYNTCAVANGFAGIDLIAEPATGNAARAAISVIATGNGTADLAFGTRNSTMGERMRITSGGNVGIGTTDNTAAYRLNVAVNGGSAYMGVTNQAGCSGDRYLRIGFGTGATVASIQGTRVNVADDVNLALQPDGGKVGIGTCSPTNNLAVQTSTANGGIDLNYAGSTYARFAMVNPGTSNDTYIGSFSNNAFRIYSNSTERMRFANTGEACFACTVCAPQIRFCGGNAALNNYEVGTWTPHYNVAGSCTGVTYYTRFGYYRRIGDTVTIWGGTRVCSNGSGTGEVKITGLPFTINCIAAYTHPAGAFSKVDSGNCKVYSVLGDTTALFFREQTATGDIVASDTCFPDGTSLLWTMTYIV